MFRLPFFILLLFCFLNSSSKAQSGNPEWINYSTDLAVWDIEIIDSDIWAATWGGLSRMNRITGQVDVFNFTNSGLRNNYIYQLAQDTSGNLWIGESCLVKFDGSNWTTFDVLPTGDTLHSVQHLCVDRFNNVWFASMVQWSSNNVDAIFRYDGTTFTKYNYALGQINGLSPDTLGNIWTVNYLGLIKFNDTTLMAFDSTNSPPFTGLMEVKTDKQNNKYVMDYNTLANSLLYKYDDSTWTSLSVPFGRMHISDDDHVWLYLDTLTPITEINDTIITYHTTPLSNYIYAFDTDSAGHLFTGIHEFGVEFDKSRLHEYDGTAWIKHNISVTPMENAYLSVIQLGADQSVWIHTDGSAIVRFKDSVWTSYNTLNSGLNSDYIHDFDIDGAGRLWVTSGLYSTAVLQMFDGNTWQVIPVPAGFSPNEVEADHLNNIWVNWVGFSGNGGLGYYDGNTWTLYNTANSGILNDNPSFLKIDGNNRLWMMNTQQSLQMFDGTFWLTYSPMNSPFTNIHNYYIDKAQNLWVWGDTAAYRFDGFSWTTITNSSVNMSYILSMAEDSLGNYWFGTVDGLFRDDGVQYTRFAPYPQPSTYYSSIMVIDSLNNIWAANNGLTVFNKNGVVFTNGLLDDPGSTEGLILYPNPAESHVYIKMPQNELKGELSIFNSIGQKVYHKLYKTSENGRIAIPVGKFTSGMYTVSLVMADGVRTGKFVKR